MLTRSGSELLIQDRVEQVQVRAGRSGGEVRADLCPSDYRPGESRNIQPGASQIRKRAADPGKDRHRKDEAGPG